MSKISLLDAAQIMEDTNNETNADDLHTAIDVAGVQAYYLKSSILVIPGTNELSDWFDFSLDFAGIDHDGHGFDVVAGDSGTLWHGGFLEHAQRVYMFAKGLRPKLIIGHSLGAASAQIVGMSLRVPTIAFASPQTSRRSNRERLPHEGWVINLCRVDDTVCYLPPKILGFRTIGSRYWLIPDKVDDEDDHRIAAYTALLKLKRVKDRVPTHWPT
ncbi:alpha/beta hydrolase family protein [Roseobacter weihaiensis]|uniref:hypothetical protein n=1 Tax=Roseobacter weihaiensis TaxID=2763262 RepID=UPI001D09FDC4|nr:hypothetical protein [Roseobacter sp. H9]